MFENDARIENIRSRKMRMAISMAMLFFVTVVGINVTKQAVNQPHQEIHSDPYPPYIDIPQNPEPIEIESEPSITNQVPPYLNYQDTVEQLKTWVGESDGLASTGTYGKSSKGQDLYFLKIESMKNADTYKPKVLITACIHGNEPLSASTVMGYIGTLMGSYGKDDQVTKLVDERVLYFIPVVSPDSYPSSRYVDGVDPNRNFPTSQSPNKKSVTPIERLKEFFLRIKPQAVISGHTYGRVYLTPWGDNTSVCEHEKEYKKIIGEMASLSRYNMMRACELYRRPIYGTEVDWYYRNGAFPIVMEFGTHQRVPTDNDIKSEFNRTYQAILYFIQHAPVARSYRTYQSPGHAA